MKYVFKLIFITIVATIGILFYAIAGLWEFNWNNMRTVWSDYKFEVARCIWKAFKINIY